MAEVLVWLKFLWVLFKELVWLGGLVWAFIEWRRNMREKKTDTKREILFVVLKDRCHRPSRQ